jgi:ubiquinone/menaquinone biosynthesis C-methylase UbiE
VDLRESMVAASNARAQKEGVRDSVKFEVADAQRLPFEDAFFDVVLCESVATFIEDKAQVTSALARVVRPGGYVGLNEEIWLKSPPPDLVEYGKLTWGIESDIPTADGWKALLDGAGLRDVVVKPYEVNARREATQLRRYRVEDMVKMFYRTLILYVKSPVFRRYMKERRCVPKDIFEYLGYALLVGQKPA